MATTTMFQSINNFIGGISEIFDDVRFNNTRAKQPTAYKEIEFVANSYKSKFGCESSNDWLDAVLTDRRGARSLLTPEHRYSVPIYNPTLEHSKNQDEYVKRSELTSIMRTMEFKNFIDNLKCKCPKH
jgi:hypothetical protein